MITCEDKLKMEVIQNQKCVSLGILPADILAFLREKKPEIGNAISEKEEIIFWNDRISHTLEHKNDFISDTLFENCFEDIPNIIREPDYISIHKTGKSISFIRSFTQNIAVVIRVTISGKMSYRTMYPLMTSQLDNYIESGNAWKYEKRLTNQ